MEKLEPSNLLTSKIVKIEESRLDLSYFFLHFHFSFSIYFSISIFRTTRVRVDWSCCQLPDGIVTRQIMELERI